MSGDSLRSASAGGQPRDGLFRLVFGNPVHAASELRSVLPAGLLEQLDLTRCGRCRGRSWGPDLRQRHVDALFTTRWAGREAYLYVLLEHQSTPDRLMAFRMLRYLVRIWERHLELNPDACRLPVVVPVMIYQGRRRWNVSTEFADRGSAPGLMETSIPGGTEEMAAQRRYPLELRERATRLAVEARRDPASKIGAIKRTDRGVQYRAIRYTQRLAEADAVASVGSKGDSYDNAMAEALNSLYKAELVRGPRQRRRGMWRGIDDLEYATAEWVEWYNQRRLHGELGHVPPAEYETAYWAAVAGHDGSDENAA